MSVGLLPDSEFIQKLIRIVEANLADENFGVRELAHKVKISRTQLHRKIKSVNNQSVSQFIREIRLNKAKEMLQLDLGTVSEIAYKVGFGSPSYFIKCFHEYFGYPPGVLLKLPSETDENRNENSELNTIVQSSISVKSGKEIQVKILTGIIGILTIAAVLFFIYRNFINDKKITDPEKSIAVLPLKNLGENKEIQHLADGIMEDILNRLSHVQELKVKSRISSEQFRNPDKSIPEIAKEMKVSYVIEGSIMNLGDKVRIYVQLIDAENDNHIWSDEYNQDLTDIFDFISGVSKNVADELQIALTSEDLKKFEENYTENKEAYNLYLLGRYFWHRKTKEDLYECVKYYEQAIARDSNYALAYAGLADAYNSLAGIGWYPFNEGVQKCKEFALKAIYLDKNLAEAHASLGDCASDYLWDWNLAEKELKLAINLNPNFALAYKYYADYLSRIGKKQEARANINIAIDLNPESYAIYTSSSELYYRERKFEEALGEIEKILGIQQSNRNPYFGKFRIYLYQNKHNEALNSLQEYLSKDTTALEYCDKLNQIYTESGINEILRTLIIYFAEINGVNNIELAQVYAFLKDKENTLRYLEKQFDSDMKFRLFWIINDPEYDFIRGEPRFIALLQKMNLADN